MFHDLSGNTVSPVEWLREYADMAAPSNGGDSEDARGLRVIADMLACLRATVTEPQGGDDSGYAEQYDRGHRAACADVLAILDSTQATPTPAVADALARAEAALERLVEVRTRAVRLDDYERDVATLAQDVRALAGQLARAEGERAPTEAELSALADCVNVAFRHGGSLWRLGNYETAQKYIARLLDLAPPARGEPAGEVGGDALAVPCPKCGMGSGARCVPVWVGDPLEVGETHRARQAALPARPSTPAAEGET